MELFFQLAQLGNGRSSPRLTSKPSIGSRNDRKGVSPLFVGGPAVVFGFYFLSFFSCSLFL